MPWISAAETVGSEQQLQNPLYPVTTDIQGKKGISKKPFAEHNSEFVSEHEEAEESPPQLKQPEKEMSLKKR